jgi:hypothetical protein
MPGTAIVADTTSISRIVANPNTRANNTGTTVITATMLNMAIATATGRITNMATGTDTITISSVVTMAIIMRATIIVNTLIIVMMWI